MELTAHDLVQRGAALLDERLPGWADQIDLESLHMANGCQCVLGQLGRHRVNLDRLSFHADVESAEYLDVIQRIGGTRIAGACGFNLADYDDIGDLHPVAEYEVSFDDLRDAWKGAVVERRTL